MSPSRNGNFTSSEIVALLSMGERAMTAAELAARPKTGKGSRTTTVEDITALGDAAWTYIQECNTERRLGRCIDREVDAKPLSWGKLNENRVHDLLGTDYQLCSSGTLDHPTIPYWKGSPDFKRFIEGNVLDAVAESKCPITLKSFCQLVDPWYLGSLQGMDFMNALRFGWTDKDGFFHKPHKDGEKYYWQIVSNSCLTMAKYAELIVYMPYKKELSEIRSLADGDPDYFWIQWATSDEKLPYLIDGGFYKNLNVFRFEVPAADKELLFNRVKLAGEKLIEYHTIAIAA
jgi:hypothetical protein